MDQLLITNARLVLPDRIQSGALLIREGRIAGIFSGDLPTGLGSSETFDAAGAYLAPGMIDIHIHGSAGVDVMCADAEGLAKLSDFLLGEGVTGYFPTLVPTDTAGYLSALSATGSFAEQQASPAARPSARVLGVHFEGPFVSKHRCGALHQQHFRTYDGDPASLDVFTLGSPLGPQTRLAAASSLLPSARLMTLAPEIAGGIALIRDLASQGVRVFIGHTQADPATLDLAAGAGARHITHFPNALDPLHHRKPGAVAWGLVRDDVTMDCIADFHHVDPLMLRLIYQAKGPDRVALISDAIPPTGLGDGVFSVWGDRIRVSGGLTGLVRPPEDVATEGDPAANGPGGSGPAVDAATEVRPAQRGTASHQPTIAGSVITMRDALRNIISLGIPLHQAIHMASLIPARAAGIDRDYGSIEVGKRADLIVLDDDLRILRPIIGGCPGTALR
jgi:N-acetylglucosamine-6-phosphate deacetylase